VGKATAVLATVFVAVGLTVSSASARSVSDSRTGLATVVPAGWHTTFDIEPHQFDAWFGTRLITDEDIAGCAGRDFTLVRVNVIERSEPPAGQSFVRRPAHFTDRDGSGVTSGYADQACESRGQYIGFTDHGRTFSAFLTFGRDASARRTRQAYAILDSLKVTKPPPSSWAAFCDAAKQTDLSRTDLASEPRFAAQLDALRRTSPSQTVARAIRTSVPVVTNPSASRDQVLAVEDDLRTIGTALMKHCGVSPANFFLWLYLHA
jgi:hypothetical protein